MKQHDLFFLQRLLIACLLAMPLLTLGQQPPCFSMALQSASGNQDDVVELPVTVRDFKEIIHIQFELNWPAADLQLAIPPTHLVFGANPLGLSAANFNTGTPGSLKFAWFNPNALSTTLPDETVLFALRLRILTPAPKYVPIRLASVPNGIPAEVVAELDGTLSFPLRVGGVYANIAPPAGPVIDSICAGISNGNCLNPTGSIAIEVSGGTPPYTFAWSSPNGFASTEQNLSQLVHGGYALTVTDQDGAVAFADVVVGTNEQPIWVGGTTQNTSCVGDDGCIQVTLSTSQWPVELAWSASGLSGQQVCGLTPGTYTVTATDAGGCTMMQAYTVAQDTFLRLNMSSTSANCASGLFGSAVALPQNGVPPYEFQWSDGSTAPLNTSLPFGTHTVTVTDVEGCTAVKQVVIQDATVSSWGMYLTIDCFGGGYGNVLLRATSPAMIQYPLTVAWDNGTTTIAPVAADTLAMLGMTPSGLYAVTATDSLGCSQRLEIVLDCIGQPWPDSTVLVWPGDADDNNAVNHHDLLYLGLAFGATGPPRPNATTEWSGQPAPDWPQSTAGNAVNFKNMDTNGDGIVNAADTAAIVANWGFVVNPQTDNPFAAPVSVPGMGGTPAPELAFVADTLFAGQMTYVSVMLGSEAAPADSLHGLAFSISYNPKILTPVFFEPLGSWLGDPDDGLLCLQRHFPGQNRIDVVLSRTDGLPTGGFGIIGRMFIIIEDDIFFRKNLDEPESEDGATVTTRLFARNIQAVTPTNAQRGVAPSTATLVIAQTVGVTVPDQRGEAVALWPNPVSDILHLAAADTPLRGVRITDLAGRLQYERENLLAVSVEIPVRGWAPGMYVVQARTEWGVATRFVWVKPK